MGLLALQDPAKSPVHYYGGYTDPDRPTWKLRALLLGVMDARAERELDRLDRFLQRIQRIHMACDGAHREIR